MQALPYRSQVQVGKSREKVIKKFLPFTYVTGRASCMLQVQMQLKNHVAAVAPAALIGALCGLLGGGFTALNLKIARLRAAATPARTGRFSSQSLLCPDSLYKLFLGNVNMC